MSKSLRLMILLAHLKFCRRILKFAGAVFKAKVTPQKTRASKILLAHARKYRHSCPQNTEKFGRKNEKFLPA
jgi:hypothetical protein